MELYCIILTIISSKLCRYFYYLCSSDQIFSLRLTEETLLLTPPGIRFNPSRPRNMTCFSILLHEILTNSHISAINLLSPHTIFDILTWQDVPLSKFSMTTIPCRLTSTEVLSQDHDSLYSDNDAILHCFDPGIIPHITSLHLIPYTKACIL